MPQEYKKRLKKSEYKQFHHVCQALCAVRQVGGDSGQDEEDRKHCEAKTVLFEGLSAADTCL